MAERLNFRLMDFKFSNSPEQRWHCPRCRSQVNESAMSNSPSKKAWRTSSHSEQAPAALTLDSGTGGRIMAMRSM
jgi:transposase-like protein